MHGIHFNFLLKDDIDLTWDELKKELLDKYGGMREGSVFDQLTTLHQTWTMEEYISGFELLIEQVPRLPEEQYFSFNSDLMTKSKRELQSTRCKSHSKG